MRKLSYIVLFMIILIIVVCFLTSGIVAVADDVDSFDESDVMVDLFSSTVNGEEFDFEDYPVNVSDSKIYMLSFIEYRFPRELSLNEDGATYYIILYSPSCKTIIDVSTLNKIEISVEYDGEKAINYEKFELEFINRSSDRRFYKYKIVESEIIFGQKFNNDPLIRRYDISGIELLTDGDVNATDYTVASSYVFTGFAKGLSSFSMSQSTLSCEARKIDVIELEVNATNYRLDGVSSSGPGYQNEIQSVYFSIPNEYLDENGVLQKIKAEWYKYNSSPIFVTNDSFIWQYFKNNMRFIFNPDYDPSFMFGVEMNENISHSLFDPVQHITYDWVYNIDLYDSAFVDRNAAHICNLLWHVYNRSLDSTIDKQSLAASIYTQLVEDFEDFPVKDGMLNPFALAYEEIFLSNENDGYNVVEIDADEDLYNLMSYDSNHSWFEKLIDFGLFAPETSEELLNVCPFYQVQYSDLFNGESDDSIADNLLVDVSDVPLIKDAYNTAVADDEVLYIFRFAQDEYFCENVEIREYINDGNNYYTLSDKAYIAQQALYFDFDIIQLTFNNSGIYTVIPVVNSPIDIINDVTPPLEDEIPVVSWFNDLFGQFEGIGETLKRIFMIIALVVLLIVLYPIIKCVVKFLVWLISLPIKAIKKIKMEMMRVKK